MSHYPANERGRPRLEEVGQAPKCGRRVWFLKGGPGQGKSTIGQYFCQIQRAAHLLADRKATPRVSRAHHTEYTSAEEVRKATKAGLWPAVPRIPLHVELKDYGAVVREETEWERAKGHPDFCFRKPEHGD